MVVLVTCKNEEDPLKNNGARLPQHFPHYKSMGIFPDAQGQVTPQSEVEPSQTSNSSEMLWLSLLFQRMKKIQSKMKFPPLLYPSKEVLHHLEFFSYF